MNSPAVDLLLALPAIRALRAKVNASFDPFDVLGIEHYELRHTTVLAWLLDPEGSHGLGDKFLKSFLAEVGLKSLYDQPSLLARENNVHVLAEVSVVERTTGSMDWRFGSKSKSKDESPMQLIQEKVDLKIADPNGIKRLDVLIDGPQWSIAIEAKVLAEEAPEQLRRYFSALEHRRESDSKRACFFLTLKPRVPGHPAWINVLWQPNVAKPLQTAIDLSPGLADPVRRFLSDYIALIDRLSAAEHPLARDIQALAAEDIYQAVDQARDEIKKLDEAGAFAPSVERNLWLLKALFKCLPNRRGILADRLLNDLTGGSWEWSNAPAYDNAVEFVPRGWTTAVTQGKPLLTYRIEVKQLSKNVEIKLWLSRSAPPEWTLKVWKWAGASLHSAIELKGTARTIPFRLRGKVFTKSFHCHSDFADVSDREGWCEFVDNFEALLRMQHGLLIEGEILAPS